VEAKLSGYRKKRDFAATPEPAGDEPAAAADAARFVIQEHHATRLHWDLRLERDGVLVSFAIPNGIPDDPAENRKAVHTEDHPLEYLDFEGEIPRGNYGAGTMRIWDRGTYRAETWQPRKIVLDFAGERVHGRYALFQTGDERDWMIHRIDPPADPDREPLPEHVVPMMAQLANLPADDTGYAVEIKWDGVRAIGFSEPGRLRLESRRGADVTAQYPELRRLNRALGSHTAVLDGEIVAFDEGGRPSFERMQRRMHASPEAARRRMRDIPVVYVLFDLLYLDDRSLMALPYRERRERLEALELSGPAWQTPGYHAGGAADWLAASRGQGLEGIVLKRLESRYEPGRRSTAWLKVKNRLRQEFVIGGWVPGEGRRADAIGALLVGYHARPGDGALRYAGKVGTGFDRRELERLGRLLAPLERERSPFAERGVPRGAVFVEPQLVAEVEFAEWTSQGTLRHPSYAGLRDDRDPAEVVREEPVDPASEPDTTATVLGEPVTPRTTRLPSDKAEATVDGRRLSLSNLDKVLYPRAGFTKGELIDYYAQIAPVLLPHLHGRPLTLKRYPNGVDQGHFYEKQCPRHRPDWVETATIWSRHKRGTIDYCLANDAATLVWLANLADIELHTSLSLAERIESPTMMVFDLDPGPPADIVACCQVGLWLKELFDGVGLQAFAKTSGSKGLQVYVPLDAEATYAATKTFSRAVAEVMERSYPDLVVSRMTKSLRPGKVLIDWSQNDEHKTTACVYSLRARERPTVSTPVDWDEVARVHETGDPTLVRFEADALLARVAERGDLFAAVLSTVQRLPSLGAA
jgi:bifunctional non-homologous end joining protein LigD